MNTALGSVSVASVYVLCLSLLKSKKQTHSKPETRKCVVYDAVDGTSGHTTTTKPPSCELGRKKSILLFVSLPNRVVLCECIAISFSTITNYIGVADSVTETTRYTIQHHQNRQIRTSSFPLASCVYVSRSASITHKYIYVAKYKRRSRKK